MSHYPRVRRGVCVTITRLFFMLLYAVNPLAAQNSTKHDTTENRPVEDRPAISASAMKVAIASGYTANLERLLTSRSVDPNKKIKWQFVYRDLYGEVTGRALETVTPLEIASREGEFGDPRHVPLMKLLIHHGAGYYGAGPFNLFELVDATPAIIRLRSASASLSDGERLTWAKGYAAISQHKEPVRNIDDRLSHRWSNTQNTIRGALFTVERDSPRSESIMKLYRDLTEEFADRFRDDILKGLQDVVIVWSIAEAQQLPVTEYDVLLVRYLTNELATYADDVERAHTMISLLEREMLPFLNNPGQLLRGKKGEYPDEFLLGDGKSYSTRQFEHYVGLTGGTQRPILKSLRAKYGLNKPTVVSDSTHKRLRWPIKGLYDAATNYDYWYDWRTNADWYEQTAAHLDPVAYPRDSQKTKDLWNDFRESLVNRHVEVQWDDGRRQAVVPRTRIVDALKWFSEMDWTVSEEVGLELKGMGYSEIRAAYEDFGYSNSTGGSSALCALLALWNEEYLSPRDVEVLRSPARPKPPAGLSRVPLVAGGKKQPQLPIFQVEDWGRRSNAPQPKQNVDELSAETPPAADLLPLFAVGHTLNGVIHQQGIGDLHVRLQVRSTEAGTLYLDRMVIGGGRRGDVQTLAAVLDVSIKLAGNCADFTIERIIRPSQHPRHPIGRGNIGSVYRGTFDGEQIAGHVHAHKDAPATQHSFELK